MKQYVKTHYREKLSINNKTVGMLEKEVKRLNAELETNTASAL